ncbi:hypothetical protein [Dactylosporangium fulvum]|uniref:Uncharacterized protein n=1 Tax=Dactylosporangium fulvum TaxID=53359 RepID=A0ABY5VUV5_9ACTN|nr:hypothetical protein [Dactylosporangium fulvum]UWP80919.1 hypothetical protein Dfulv_38190 [Dactylosporangium fulvum]
MSSYPTIATSCDTRLPRLGHLLQHAECQQLVQARALGVVGPDLDAMRARSSVIGPPRRRCG